MPWTSSLLSNYLTASMRSIGKGQYGNSAAVLKELVGMLTCFLVYKVQKLVDGLHECAF